jgi:hypothetical protein
MKIHFITFSIGLLLGLFLSTLYRRLLPQKEGLTYGQAKARELRKEASNSVTIFRLKTDSLQNQNKTLQTELQKTRITLAAARKP